MNDPRNRNWIGRGLKRFEDERLVTGLGRYVDDQSSPGTLHAAFVRSPYPHGTIRSIDTAATAAAAGVVAVFTGADVADLGDLPVNPLVPGVKIPRFPILAHKMVMAVGEPVVAIVAETREAAADAADLVDIDVEPLDAVVDPAAVTDEAVARRWQKGNVEAMFAAADVVVRAHVAHPRLAPASLEPRAVLATAPDESGVLTVWLSTQTPHRARTDLARIIGLDSDRIRVVAPDVGGAFGMKASLYPEEVLVVWASLRLQRPVKWTATRSEDMLSASHGRGAAGEGEIALTSDGTVTALRARITHPLGHWLPFSAAVPAWNSGRVLPGPYAVETIDVTALSRVTNTAPVGIYRGAGRPEAAMIMERLMDDAARATGIDPLDLRRRNVIAADRFPYRTPTGETFDSADFLQLLERAAELSDYAALRSEQARRRNESELVGVGVALYVEPCGRGWESARVTLESSGAFVVSTGSTSQGQGRETAFAQIAAEVLSVPPSAIEVRHGDTAATPRGIGALASRSTAIGGSALLRAAEQVRERARAVAARLLQASPETLVPCEFGFESCTGTGRRASWQSIAEEAGRSEASDGGAGAALASTVEFSVPSEAWASGCCIATVAVDRDTGAVTVERLVWVDDAGTVVNPMLVQGQLVGGIAQGLGEALMERVVYDSDGQSLSGSLMDYALPRAADMPPITIDHTVTPSPNNPLGAKGVGEAGPIGAPAAILNAAIDALSPLGVRHLDLPLTSESVWRAIADATRQE